MPDWMEPFVPPLRLVLVLAPPAAVFGVLAAALAARLHVSGVRTAYTRKVFHFIIFTAATAVHLVWGTQGVVVYGTAVALPVVYALLQSDGHPFYEALARPADAPRRSRFILIPLITTALGGVLANVFFTPFGYVGYMVCGWGDAVAEPVGARWGRHRYRVPSMFGVPATRSLEGSASVLVAGAAAAFFALVLAGVQPVSALPVALLCGAASSAVEAASTHGLDNLTVQLAAAGVAWLMLT